MYDEKFCDELINHAKSGRSFKSFGAVANVSRKTLYEWVKNFPDFAEAKDQAYCHSLKFFEDRLIAKCSGQDFENIKVNKICTSSLLFALKTRYHEVYGDHSKVDNNHNFNFGYEITSTGES